MNVDALALRMPGVAVAVLAALAAAASAGACGRSRSPGSGQEASRSASSALSSGAGSASAAFTGPGASAAIAPSPARPPKPIPKFDIHAHIDPEVAPAAEELMRSYGVSGAVNLSGGWEGEGLEENLTAARETHGFFVTYANIDFSGIGTAGWANREVKRLERAKALGAKGVKIPKSLGLAVRYPDGRRVPVDDPVLDPVFAAMARLGMPLSIHTGDPRAFFDPISPANERLEELANHPGWSFADRDRFPTWEGLFSEFERRVKRSKATTIVGVHFGNAPEEPAWVGRMLDECPNYYVDTAARVPELGRRPEEVRRVILAHPDRVLFGTDLQAGMGMLVLGAGPARGHRQADVNRFFLSSWRFFETDDRGFLHPTPIQGRWNIDGLALPDDVLEKVYHRNAERLLGLAPLKAAAPAP